MYNAFSANNGIMIKPCPGKNHGSLPKLCIIADICMRIDLYIICEDDLLADKSKLAHINILTYLSCFMDKSMLANP